MAAGRGTDWDVIAELRRVGASLLGGLERELGSGRELSTELKVGYVLSAVAAAAERHRATFLVVGSRGLGSVGALILGSVSRSLAPCAGTIVRAAYPGRAES